MKPVIIVYAENILKFTSSQLNLILVDIYITDISPLIKINRQYIFDINYKIVFSYNGYRRIHILLIKYFIIVFNTIISSRGKKFQRPFCAKLNFID